MYRGNGYIERHYPTMELEEITALPVKELAAKENAFAKSEPSEAGPIWRRKKELADMEFSRLLRKPRKWNGASFF